MQIWIHSSGSDTGADQTLLTIAGKCAGRAFERQLSAGKRGYKQAALGPDDN